jgi:hypothetical protein
MRIFDGCESVAIYNVGYVVVEVGPLQAGLPLGRRRRERAQTMMRYMLLSRSLNPYLT